MKEGMKINDHLTELNKIIWDLSKIHVNLEEEGQTLLFLSNLPSSYEYLVTTQEDIIKKFYQTLEDAEELSAALLYGKDKIGVKDFAYSLLSNALRKKGKDGDYQAKGLVEQGRAKDKGSNNC